MRIAFNMRHPLLCVPNKDMAIKLQGYELRAEAGAVAGRVEVLPGQVFNASLIPNPRHEAVWLGLNDTPEGVIIGAAFGSLADCEVLSH